MADIHSQLDDMHGAFVRALHDDQEPLSETAMFWYEALRVDRDPAAPSATARGTALLHYQRGAKKLKDVPGQDFALDARPARVCTALISDGAADWGGPRMISFRYDRVDSVWTGGHAVETSAEYRDQVVSRRALDGQFAQAMGDHWDTGVTQVRFVYGVASQEDPGPRVMVYREGVRAPEFVAPSDGLLQTFQQFKAHVEGGRWRLYYAAMVQEKARASLAEGDTIQVRYGR